MSLWKRYGEAVQGPDDLTMRRLEKRVLERDAPRRTRARWVVAVGVLGAVVVAFVLLRAGEPAPDWVAISTSTRVQEVSLPHDGAMWVGVDSRVEVVASDASGAVVRLREGDVTLHVHSGEGLRWRVEVDDYAVEALGTRFQVRRTDAAPDVHVEEGVVRLTGPGQPDDGLLIRAVEPATVVARDDARDESRVDERAAVEVTPAPAVEERPADVADPPDAEADDAEPTPRPRDPKRAWVETFRKAIAAGDEAAAVAALPPSFPTGREAITAADYLDAGDAVASQRDSTRAESAYRAACRRTDAPACGVATFRRALMASRRSDPKEAIRLATVYLDEHPDGSLAREVLGRRMRWQSVHGSAAAAGEDARDYLARWPTGPHADLARSILDEP